MVIWVKKKESLNYPLIVEYLNIRIEIQKNVQNLDLLQSMMADGKLSEDEYNEAPIPLGMRNTDELYEKLLVLENLTNEKEKRHQLSEKEPEEQQFIINEAFNEADYENKTSCWDVDYLLFSGSNIAVNVLEHIGCAALDATVVGAPLGAICHTTVLIHGLIGEAQCQREHC